MESRAFDNRRKALKELCSNTCEATETKTVNELVEDTMIAYVEELTQVREMLNSRFDDLETGKMQPIGGAEARAWLREKSEARRAERRA